MTSLDKYTSFVRDNLGVRPIFPFGLPLQLGTVGTYSDGTFRLRGTVNSVLRTHVGTVATTGGSEATWYRTSGSEVGVKVLANGELSQLFPQAPAVNARVEVGFGSSNAFMLLATNVRFRVLEDPATLLASIADAYRRGVWQKDDVLVYQLVEPERTLLLLSESAGSQVLLKADVDALPGGLANTTAALEILYQKNAVTRFEGANQATFFNAYRVKESFWTASISVVELDGAAALAQFETV